MLTVGNVIRLTVADFAKAGLFDGKDREGFIGLGEEKIPFSYKARGCGLLILGGRSYHFDLIPSNLNRGHLRYFLCPITWKRTRTLYRPSANLPFGHRCAFRPVLGYISQLAGRKYHLQRTFQMEAKAERIREGIRRWEHKGQPTRRVQRLEALEERTGAYMLHAVGTSRLFQKIAAWTASTKPKSHR